MRRSRMDWLLVLLVASGSSCAENDERLRVSKLAKGPKGVTGECVLAPPADSDAGLTRGILDLAAVEAFQGAESAAYRVHAVVENRLVAPGTGELNDLTPSPGVAVPTVVITDLIAEWNPNLQMNLRSLAGISDGETRFRTPLFLRLASGQSSVASGIGIPDSAARKLLASRASFLPDSATEIVTSIRVRVAGKKDGVSDIESSFVDLPVSICYGCIFSRFPSCSGVLPDVIRTGNACSAVQDDALTCCDSASGFLRCPAKAEMPPAGMGGTGGTGGAGGTGGTGG